MKIIVTELFGLDEPGTPDYHQVKPSDKPQTVLRRVGLAAIKAGCATEYKPKQKLKGKDHGES